MIICRLLLLSISFLLGAYLTPNAAWFSTPTLSTIYIDMVVGIWSVWSKATTGSWSGYILGIGISLLVNGDPLPSSHSFSRLAGGLWSSQNCMCLPMWLMYCQTLGPRVLKLGLHTQLDQRSNLPMLKSNSWILLASGHYPKSEVGTTPLGFYM